MAAIHLFKNTEDIDLVEKKITLLSPNFFDIESLPYVDYGGIGQTGDILNYDIDDFFKDVNDLIETLKDSDNSIKGFTFRHSSAHELPSDGIDLRFNILKRTPATWSAGVGPHEGKQQYKYKPLSVFDDLENPGYSTIVYGQFMDNTIVMVPWAKTWTTANRAAHTLEDFIPDYTWYYQKRGMQQIRYLGRGEDLFQSTEQNALYGCPLMFYVRTLKIKKVQERKLEEIIVKLYK